MWKISGVYVYQMTGGKWSQHPKR